MAKDSNKEPDYTTRNTLTVGGFAGAVVGFYIAMWLGFFKYESSDSATDWIVAVTAIAAAFISGLAVVLVAQTLKATQDTLKATQDMAKDQTRIGEAQIRPWVYYHSAEILRPESQNTEIIPKFKNFGATPARNLKMLCKTLQVIPPHMAIDVATRYTDIQDFPPTSTITVSTGEYDEKSMLATIVYLEWIYEIFPGLADVGNIILLVKIIDQKKVVEPITLEDYADLDRIGNVVSGTSKQYINLQIHGED